MADRDKRKPNKSNPQKTAGVDFWWWAALGLVIIVAVVIRGRLLAIPLERDEGEYAYIAQQMLKGVPPYLSAYSMKLPGIYAVYALILSVFGQTATAIHLGLVIFNAATILVIFLLAKNLFGPLAGLASAVAYAIASLVWSMQGLSANAEHFVVLPALVGLLLICKDGDKRRYARLFAAGLILGLAFIIKQHGIFFAVFGAAYLFYADLRSRPIQWGKAINTQIVFAAGVAIPFALVCLILWRVGVFEKFWFWTFIYANKYATFIPLSKAWEMFIYQFMLVLGSTTLIWLFALLGLLVVIIVGRFRQRAVFAVGLLVFSFLAVCLGFYFRGHYFLLWLPAVAILAGAGFADSNNRLAGRNSSLRLWPVTALIGLAVVGLSLFQQRAYLFYNTPADVCRLIYGANPFPESLKIAEFIRANSSSDDTVAVLGSEPQIYFYSNRRAATRYIYTYPLMEPHPYATTMQKEMIDEIESAKPKWIVFVRASVSWLGGPDSVKDVIEWSDSYVSNFYYIVGVIEMLSNGEVTYRWNEQVAGYDPTSGFWIAVFKRKH